MIINMINDKLLIDVADGKFVIYDSNLTENKFPIFETTLDAAGALKLQDLCVSYGYSDFYASKIASEHLNKIMINMNNIIKRDQDEDQDKDKDKEANDPSDPSYNPKWDE